MLSVANAENDNLEGSDVDNAYLYGDIDIDNYMEQTTHSTQIEARSCYVCKPLKYIYGDKQAGGIRDFNLDKSLKE